MRRERIKRCATAAFVFALVFLFLQRLLVPKYATELFHGNMISEYYASAKDHNIIFIGDCEVFATFSPVVLWEEFGVTSFVRGSAQQLVWQSYYLLEETLRLERPDVIVFSVLAMQYGEPQSEAYNRLTLGGMRWSRSKIRAIQASRTEEEDFLSYVFPLLRFKDRWQEIGTEDFRYFFRRPQVTVNGFMINSGIRPPSDFSPPPLRRANYDFGEKAVYYLQRITNLAAYNDIPLVLVKAPTLYPHWPVQWNEQIVNFAEKNNLLYVNLLEYIYDIGLDFSKHTFDYGYTLNVFGAEKTTRFFGEILVNEFDLHNIRKEFERPEGCVFPIILTPQYVRWAETTELYHRVIARQLAEIERYGTIQNFRAE
ncbi:MAG: SGNH/GDSL hydrolase family protein [Firmicutes bacterium]|nr:SGNH/GDSL hydrolase family protein [Bacillota bacterium]